MEVVLAHAVFAAPRFLVPTPLGHAEFADLLPVLAAHNIILPQSSELAKLCVIRKINRLLLCAVFPIQYKMEEYSKTNDFSSSEGTITRVLAGQPQS
jgi:hypothetical protein